MLAGFYKPIFSFLISDGTESDPHLHLGEIGLPILVINITTAWNFQLPDGKAPGVVSIRHASAKHERTEDRRCKHTRRLPDVDPPRRASYPQALQKQVRCAAVPRTASYDRAGQLQGDRSFIYRPLAALVLSQAKDSFSASASAPLARRSHNSSEPKRAQPVESTAS